MYRFINRFITEPTFHVMKNFSIFFSAIIALTLTACSKPVEEDPTPDPPVPVTPTTVTISPLRSTSEMNIIKIGNTDDTRYNNPDIAVEAWTQSGNPYTVRGVVKFDLAAIPSAERVQSAKLRLYSYPSPTLNGNLLVANFGMDNSLLVQRITTIWGNPGVNWFNQPSTTTAGQIVVPHTSSSVLDLELDVTALVKTMMTENANYGFMLRLQNENIYTSRIFVSSHSPVYPDKRPALEVVYK